MKNSMWIMILAMILVFAGAIHAIATKTFHSEWFIGAIIVQAIMGLTMELERKK